MFELMHRNIRVADLRLDKGGRIADVGEIVDRDHMPVGTVRTDRSIEIGMAEWWNSRSIPASRDNLRTLLDKTGVGDVKALLSRSMGLSLSDQYWIRPRGSDILWEDVNFFDNPFSEDVGDVLFGKEVRGSIELASPDNTSDGMLVKRWKIIDGRRCLIKAGRDPFHQEPFNEAVASAVLDLQDAPHTRYDLIWIDGAPCSICDDFVDRDTELVTAARIVSGIGSGDSHRDEYELFCESHGVDISHSMGVMDLIDHVMINTDRHLGNYGLIRNADTLEWICAAPIYDTGTSLMCRRGADSILESIQHINDNLSMPGRLFHADLDWLDVDGLYDALPEAERILRSGVGRHGMEDFTDKRVDAIMSLLEERIHGVEEFLIRHRSLP